jgi:hypothetical protein
VSAYRFISAEKARTPVSVACRWLGVSRSGYYEWATRAPSERALTDAWLTERIRAIHEAHRGVHGAPRIHADLRLARDGADDRRAVLGDWRRRLLDAGLAPSTVNLTLAAAVSLLDSRVLPAPRVPRVEPEPAAARAPAQLRAV